MSYETRHGSIVLLLSTYMHLLNCIRAYLLTSMYSVFLSLNLCVLDECETADWSKTTYRYSESAHAAISGFTWHMSLVVGGHLISFQKSRRLSRV